MLYLLLGTLYIETIQCYFIFLNKNNNILLMVCNKINFNNELMFNNSINKSSA